MRSHQNTIHTGRWAKKKLNKKNKNTAHSGYLPASHKTKTRLFCAAHSRGSLFRNVSQINIETGCTKLPGAAQPPLAVPLINNTSWKLSCMTMTTTAPNLVQSQRWGCDSTASVLGFSLFSRSEQLDSGEHVQNFDQEQ